jgi:uncharacterized membrane protein SirB2
MNVSPTTTPLTEPRHTDLTARLAAQGAMLEELRAIAPLVAAETARADARRLIIDENVLQRPSLSSRTEVFKKLSFRYLRADSPQTVSRFVRAIQTVADPLYFGLLAYTILLWTDVLVFTLGADWLAPKLAGAAFEAVTADIELEFEQLTKRFTSLKNWTPITRHKVATHYLGLLRDCGFATGSARKVLRRPFVPPDVVLFGARLIIGGGEPAAAIPEHGIFAALGLSVNDVLEALTELRQEGRIEFAIQGSVAHFVDREASGL